MKLQESNRRMPIRGRSYYKTHPYVADRIRVVKQELNQPLVLIQLTLNQEKLHPQCSFYN
jgi:hypothetical protein